MQIKLTEKSVAAIEPPTDKPQKFIFDAELAGFGVVVGATGVRSYFVSGRVGPRGEKIRVVIGKARPGPWPVDAARRRARAILGQLASGGDPRAGRRAASDRLTLREALEQHLQEMRDKGRRSISIKTMRYDVERLLARHIDKPLDALTVEAVNRIKAAGADHKTQTNRLLAHLSAIWNTARRVRKSTFTAASPIGEAGVQKYALGVMRVDEFGVEEWDPEIKRPRIHDADLPEWLLRVESLSNRVRRDLQLTALFTGLRDASVRVLRWSMVDLERGALVFPRSKTVPFTIPAGPTVAEILRARRADNEIVFAAHGGDRGWVFPAARPDGAIGPIAETKERRAGIVPWGKDGPRGEPSAQRVLFLPGLHTLRRTFTSVAHEIGVNDLDQRVLINHSIGGRKLHELYVVASFEHLRTEVGRIDAELWRRLGRPR